MVKLQCLDCDEVFEANTKDEMLTTMLPHYIDKHHTIMDNLTEESKEEWMQRFHKNWEEASK